MSDLAAMSGHMAWEERQLRDLNSWLLAVESDSLGRAPSIGVSPSEIATARVALREFVAKLQAALLSTQASSELESVADLLKSSPHPASDWVEDLKELDSGLGASGPLAVKLLPILEELLDLLDSEFSNGLRRLYGR